MCGVTWTSADTPEIQFPLPIPLRTRSEAVSVVKAADAQPAISLIAQLWEAIPLTDQQALVFCAGLVGSFFTDVCLLETLLCGRGSSLAFEECGLPAILQISFSIGVALVILRLRELSEIKTLAASSNAIDCAKFKMDERPLVDTGKEIYQISGRSIEAGLHRPGHKQACSVDAGWRSVLLQTFTQPGTVEAFETTGSPDHLLVFCLEGDYRIESFACGRWTSAQYRPGLGGYTSPMVGNRLRWHSRWTDELRVVRLYIPDAYFQEAGEELRPAGKPPGRLPDSLLLPAPTAFGIATSLLQQMALGAPDLYADAAARVIAANLLVSHQVGQAPMRLEQPRALKPDRRLQRASDFLHEHFREEVTLNRLAREAGMSAFHLSREYKALFGYTPHRHQICLRLQHARELLLRTDLSVQEITLECGYSHGGHFAAAFRTEFAVEPLAFRIKARRKE